MKDVTKTNFELLLIIIFQNLSAQDISVISPSKLNADSFYREKEYKNAAIYYEKYLLYEGVAFIDRDYILLAYSFYKAGIEEKAIWVLSFLVKAFVYSECQEIQLYFKHTPLENNEQYK